MLTKWLGPLLLMCLVVVNVSAQEKETSKAKVDPSGTWKWERDFNGNKINYTLRLKWHDNKLTGTYQTIFENGGPGLADPVEILDGKLVGEAISFSAKRRFNDNDFTVAYSGKLANDQVTGKSSLDTGNGPREFDWNAKRVVAIEDVVGKWKLKFETPNGVIEPNLTLAIEGEKLTGTYHSTLFGDNPIKDAELKDNKLSFAVAIKNDNGEIRITYKAEPRGEKMTGVFKANFGGQENETPFEGTRSEAPKANAQAKKK